MKNRLFLLLAVVTVFFLGGLMIVRSNSATFRVENYWKDISLAASEQGFTPSLIAAVAYVESKGNPQAVSSSGAIGLMQLKADAASDAAKSLKLPPPSREDLMKPQLNLRLGAAYLKRLLNQFNGDIDLAIMAYFSGPGTVQKELDKSNGNADEMKSRLKDLPQSSGEYLLQVRDFETRFRDRNPDK